MLTADGASAFKTANVGLILLLLGLILGFSASRAGATTPTCELYPIAVPDSVLSCATPGQQISNMALGCGEGNFGWLSWAGSSDATTLATSLTPPGNTSTYVNPDNSADRVVSTSDWTRGGPNVSNSTQVRDALDVLKTRDIMVVVWHQTKDTRGNAA